MVYRETRYIWNHGRHVETMKQRTIKFSPWNPTHRMLLAGNGLWNHFLFDVSSAKILVSDEATGNAGSARAGHRFTATKICPRFNEKIREKQAREYSSAVRLKDRRKLNSEKQDPCEAFRKFQRGVSVPWRSIRVTIRRNIPRNSLFSNRENCSRLLKFDSMFRPL